MNCEELKNLGNEQFKEGNYKEAIEYFNKAIEANETNHVLYSNRSAAYLSLGKGQNALDDANKCLELESSWAKGYGRKGAALHMLGKYEEAIESFNVGLELENDNLYLKSGLELVLKDQENKKNLNVGSPMESMMQKLMSNDKINERMNDPEFIRKIYSYQKNPLEMMKDVEMMQIFGNIMGELNEPNSNSNHMEVDTNDESTETDTDSDSDSD